MGYAVYAQDGRDKAHVICKSFSNCGGGWAFDAVAEYGLPGFCEQANSYENLILEITKKFPDQLVTGGYYKALISSAIESFGWEMLLMGLSDMNKMGRVLDSFYRYTLFHMEAWAKTSVEVIITHDDFVWTSGAFIHPDTYRKIIIPRYAELWKRIYKAGKKNLFCSEVRGA